MVGVQQTGLSHHSPVIKFMFILSDVVSACNKLQILLMKRVLDGILGFTKVQ